MAYQPPPPPSSPFELELTISSAKDLKNVNWKHGDLKPYAVVWVDPKNKFSTKVDESGDDDPIWNETLVIPLPSSPIEDSTLFIDIVHAYAAEDTKPLIGSTRISMKEVIDDGGMEEWVPLCLKLKRPSGRPHGKLEIKVKVRQISYRAPDPYYHYPAPPPAPYPYTAAPYGYPNASYGPSGYPYSGPPQYGNPGYYGQGQGAYGAPGYVGGQEEKSKSKYGVGTGLAVGAVAGVLGGLALAEGVDYVEDKIEDDVAERVEDDLGYDDDD